MRSVYFASASPMSLMRGMEQFVLSGVLPQLKGVCWHKSSNAYTDGKTIFLPEPFMGMSATDIALWRYKIQHEIGHESACNASPHWKTVMEVEKKKNPDALLWQIINLLSDHVQERNSLGVYYGRDGILLQGRQVFLECEVFPTLKSKEKMAQLFLYDTFLRKEWNPFISFKESLIDKKMFESLDACGNWRSMCNERDTFEMGLKIRELFPEVPFSEELQEGTTVKVPGMHASLEKSKTGLDPMPRTFMDDGSRVDVSMAKRLIPRKPVTLATKGRS